MQYYNLSIEVISRSFSERIHTGNDFQLHYSVKVLLSATYGNKNFEALTRVPLLPLYRFALQSFYSTAMMCKRKYVKLKGYSLISVVFEPVSEKHEILYIQDPWNTLKL